MNSQQYKIIIPISVSPTADELSAAKILANFFRASVEFFPRAAGKTPDFRIKNQFWELKSPRGNGKHTIEHQLERAARQSTRIVLDLRRTRIDRQRAVRRALHKTKELRTIKEIVVIFNSQEVIKIL